MPEEEDKYGVRFADETMKEFRKLGNAARVDILRAVKKKLTKKPSDYGEPLIRELVGYRKLPVGQWRVVYHVDEGDPTMAPSGVTVVWFPPPHGPHEPERTVAAAAQVLPLRSSG